MVPVAERRRRRARRNSEEGRRALLDAGRSLAHEQPAGPPLEHIRLTDVAERAGVSVGALYHYWDSQDDYRDDLLDEVFAPARFEPPSEAPVFASPLDEVIRVGASAEFERLRSSADLRVLMAMWSAADPDITPRVTEHFRTVGAQWAAFYACLAPDGRGAPPPFPSDPLAALLAAIGDGLAVRDSADPGSVPTTTAANGVPDEEADAAWTLLGAALVALLPAFSRPRGSDATFADFLDELRAALPAPASASADDA